MGRSIGELSWNGDDGASLGESLLYATVCIVGLPVDVHVRNGSVYSGIFHTASVEGVILKKARMTKKGRSNSNVASGCMIETLVILVVDLVQVIAKGVQLPADGITGTIAGDESESAIGTASHDVARADNRFGTITTSKGRPHQRKTSIPSGNGLTDGDTCPTLKVSSQRQAENENEGKSMSIEVVENVSEEGIEKRGRKIHTLGGGVFDASANERQVDENPQVKQDDFNRESEYQGDDKASAMQGSSPSSDACLSQVKHVDGTHSELPPPLQPSEASDVAASASAKSNNETYCSLVSSENAASCCGLASTLSLVGTSGRSLSSMVSPTEKFHLQGPESNKRAKESKLNPGAKIFSPALTKPVPATSPLVQTATGMPYVPSASPLLPVATAQAEVGTNTYIPQPSVPAKVLQYNNFTAENGDIGAISQAFAGNMGSRAQLLRYGGQHHPLPLGSTFVHPNPQAVMVGRMGQLLYMPVSQDLVQSATAISPAFPRPLPAISQAQFPKHQGTLPGQPFVHQPTVGGQQLYAAASPPPLLQSPFLTDRPISVPRANGVFNAKFL
ncbi:polyadenylate-binding protein-interacting protein 4 [Rhodamnia argentea]|uniref:Polyadenylate-binding protein-interacting protein 4 n=1 Tax=Rhodamnia argentea TaxID=178133 RepID=A0A8B8Q774_9MYRT|nr:polyadenylate-binding protein-interacting protein 4 [Rhodamnia argentea]